jgi:hypothetical protein
LGGSAPVSEEVFRRTKALTHQLETKKKQLEARQLVILELDHLAAFLTHEAALSMPGTLHLRGEVSPCPTLRTHAFEEPATTEARGGGGGATRGMTLKCSESSITTR